MLGLASNDLSMCDRLSINYDFDYHANITLNINRQSVAISYYGNCLTYCRNEHLKLKDKNYNYNLKNFFK